MEKKIIYRTLLLEALDNVAQSYYKLKTTYEPTGIVRERAFCYELYHHIRLRQEYYNDMRLSLNGEIDKRGHREFRKEDRKNPDFVFHIPGEMEGNTILIEVKGNVEKKYKKKAVKDIKTLIVFIEKYKYHEGIFLVYNYSLQELCFHLKNAFKNEFSSLSDVTAKKINIIAKKASVMPTETSLLSDLL